MWYAVRRSETNGRNMLKLPAFPSQYKAEMQISGLKRGWLDERDPFNNENGRSETLIQEARYIALEKPLKN